MWVYWLSDFGFEGYKFWYVGIIIIITIIVTLFLIVLA